MLLSMLSNNYKVVFYLLDLQFPGYDRFPLKRITLIDKSQILFSSAKLL